MATKHLQLTIMTPDQTLYGGKVHQVTLPGSAGTFQVLVDHAPLVSTLQPGTVIYQEGEDAAAQTLAIKEGMVEVLNNQVIVLLASA